MVSSEEIAKTFSALNNSGANDPLPKDVRNALLDICSDLLTIRLAEKWIPVSEGLPRNDDYYEIEYMDSGVKAVGIAMLIERHIERKRVRNWYMVDSDFPLAHSVIAYRPMRKQ